MTDDASKMTTHNDVQHGTSRTHLGNDDEPKGPQPSVAAFSVAQALSMVRRRREEQERSRQEHEKLLEEQRRERAKEKRQRRRQNQKERRAKLRENTCTHTSPNLNATCDLDSGKNGYVINEATDNQAGGTKRPLDHETEGGSPSRREGGNGEIDIKKLPVKKRPRLDSVRAGTLTGAATTSNAVEVTPIDGGTTEVANAPTSASELNQSNEGRSKTNVRKVPSLVPRALLLKRSRS